MKQIILFFWILIASCSPQNNDSELKESYEAAEYLRSHAQFDQDFYTILEVDSIFQVSRVDSVTLSFSKGCSNQLLVDQSEELAATYISYVEMGNRRESLRTEISEIIMVPTKDINEQLVDQLSKKSQEYHLLVDSIQDLVNRRQDIINTCKSCSN
jgi:hypothetical protein